jgi:hypothetical protein
MIAEIMNKSMELIKSPNYYKKASIRTATNYTCFKKTVKSSASKQQGGTASITSATTATPRTVFTTTHFTQSSPQSLYQSLTQKGGGDH